MRSIGRRSRHVTSFVSRISICSGRFRALRPISLRSPRIRTGWSSICHMPHRIVPCRTS